MRLHISLDDALVEQLDRRVGRRRRSAFIAQSVRHALEEERRWEDVEAAVGALSDAGHDWDGDPAAWVRSQRRADDYRIG